MQTEILAELIVKIVFLAILGVVLRKTGIIDDALEHKMSAMLVNVIIPISILAACGAPKQAGVAGNMVWATLAIAAYYITAFVGVWLLGKALPLGPGHGQFVNLAAFANVGFIGFPIIGGLYGSEGTIYTAIYNLFFQLLIFTVGVKLYGGRLPSGAHFLRQPIVLTVVAGIALFLSPISLPQPLLATFDLVGNMAAPFSLFIVGSSLTKVRVRSIFTSWQAWVVALLRQLIFPLAMAGIFYAMGLKGILPSTLVVITALPSATLNVVFSQTYKSNVPMATYAVSLGTLLMLATLPLSVLLCSVLFF